MKEHSIHCGKSRRVGEGLKKQGPISEKPDKPTIDLTTYRPMEMEDAKFVDGLAPARDFSDGGEGKWLGSMTSQGVIIVSMVHRDYPQTVCQVQMSPDEKGMYHTFFLHGGPDGTDMPHQLAERLFADAFPNIAQQLKKNTGHA